METTVARIENKPIVGSAGARLALALTGTTGHSRKDQSAPQPNVLDGQPKRAPASSFRYPVLTPEMAASILSQDQAAGMVTAPTMAGGTGAETPPTSAPVTSAPGSEHIDEAASASAVNTGAESQPTALNTSAPANEQAVEETAVVVTGDIGQQPVSAFASETILPGREPANVVVTVTDMATGNSGAAITNPVKQHGWAMSKKSNDFKVENPLQFMRRKTTWKEDIEYLRSQDIPVEEIRTYDQFRQYHRDFCDGKEPFIIIVGQRGVGKSVLYENIPASAYISAKSTTRASYEWAYDNSAVSGNFDEDQKLVIDDVDKLLFMDDSVALLKNLGSSASPKRIFYNAHNMGKYPKEFLTTSPACLIFNKLPDIANDNVLAVLDRGLTLYFFPTPAEVHRYVGSFWVKGKLQEEIYAFVGRQIGAGAITRLSIRAVCYSGLQNWAGA